MQSLLYIAPVLPALSGNGLAMRAGAVLEALAARYKVSLLVVELYTAVDAALPPHFRSLCERCVVTSPERAGGAFQRSEFDIVHVFRLATVPWAASYRGYRQLDLDDIESKSNRRLANLYRLNGCAPEAAWHEAEASRVDLLEAEAFRSFDRILVCSGQDKDVLRRKTSTALEVLPNITRVPVGSSAVRPVHQPFRLLFVGSLGVYANEDAAVYFCEAILPILRRLAPIPFTVDLVGTNPSRRLQQVAEDSGVRVVGPVIDVAPWYQAADAVIVPLRTGGGTRIKILEAFAHMRPLIATPVGAEGLDAIDREHLLLAQEPEAFARCCAELMGEPSLGARLAHNAAELVSRRYTMATLRKTIGSFSELGARPRFRASGLLSWSR